MVIALWSFVFFVVCFCFSWHTSPRVKSTDTRLTRKTFTRWKSPSENDDFRPFASLHLPDFANYHQNFWGHSMPSVFRGESPHKCLSRRTSSEKLLLISPHEKMRLGVTNLCGVLQSANLPIATQRLPKIRRCCLPLKTSLYEIL